jgi:thiol-disulfide isomerase/thioredoxin
MKKENINWILRLIISALFIVSAVAKLYPSPYFAISTFEVKQLYPLGFTEGIAPYFSRFLIGIEFALGMAILLPHYLKKITIPATVLLLSIFVIHLSYTTFSSGNAGNCGCFGELIPMTPVEAIIKNILAIGLLVWLFKLTPSDNKSNLWVLISLTLGCILGLFMMAPMKANSKPVITLPNEMQNIGISSDTTFSKVIATVAKAIDSSHNTVALKVDEPVAKKSGFSNYFSGIDQDKKILCFFAPGCEHCQETAKELTEMKRKDKNFPAVSIIFMDEESEKIPEFFNVAGTKYPYQVVDIISFWNLIGNTRDTPGVKYLWNGNEILFYDGINANKFNALELKKTLKKNYSELKK